MDSGKVRSAVLARPSVASSKCGGRPFECRCCRAWFHGNHARLKFRPMASSFRLAAGHGQAEPRARRGCLVADDCRPAEDGRATHSSASRRERPPRQRNTSWSESVVLRQRGVGACAGRDISAAGVLRWRAGVDIGVRADWPDGIPRALRKSAVCPAVRRRNRAADCVHKRGGTDAGAGQCAREGDGGASCPRRGAGTPGASASDRERDAFAAWRSTGNSIGLCGRACDRFFR